MSYTTDYNIPLMPAGPVDWPAIFNDLAAKLEIGRTLRLTAHELLTVRQGYYINTDGEAQKATSSSNVDGIWQTTSTGAGVTGFGQVSGTVTYGSWTWTPGANLYMNINGNLTAVESTSKIIVAKALSATKIQLKVGGSASPVSVAVVLSASPPADTSVLWIDIS